MSSNFLIDLDSFYRQQPDKNGSKIHINEEDWGDFQGSQDLVDDGRLSDMGIPSLDKQIPKSKSSDTNLLFDAVEEIGKGISSQNVSSEPANPKASIIPKQAGAGLSPIKKYNRGSNTGEQNGDLAILDKDGSRTIQSLMKATITDIKPGSTSKAVDSVNFEEEWADFTPMPAVRKSSKANELTNFTGNSLRDQFRESEQEPPPTNVPQPALILTLFIQIISESKKELIKLTNSCKNQISHTDHAEDADFLRAYVETARVLARIIAGRRLRWKRDQLLSQGMKIGPASVKRASGMKLAGIDKAEMGREEKEVLDIVEVWREQLGRLRSVAAAFVKSGFDKIGTIPDIQLNIPVKTLKEIEGGLSSTQPCALCGLKRNERVNKADTNVHDSFGEWWIESTNMHRTCKYFWQSHKSKLRSS